MNKKDMENKIESDVMELIKSGGLRARPRIYFLLRLALTIIVAIAVSIISVFILGFIIFSIRESGEQFLLGFGASGLLTFFLLFPWLYLLLDIAVMFVLERLIKGFKLGYRVSMSTIFLLIFIISLFSGLIIDKTPIESILLKAADNGSLPVFGNIYESIRDSHQDNGVYRGTVVSIKDNKMIITHNDNDHDEDDGSWMVALPSMAPSTLSLKVGDRVYVFGYILNNIIIPKGIGKLSSDQ